MSNTYTISLEGRVTGGASIEFVRAEMPAGRRTPFVLIRYRDNGSIPEFGLRLDLDKRVLMDHLSDPKKDGIIKKAVPRIVEIVGQDLAKSAEASLIYEGDG